MNTTDNLAQKSIPNITITMIFEGSALNRNEKLGTNFLSIKKFIVNGEERAYISKVALRHYLFSTLQKAFNWQEAKLTTSKEVIQLDAINENVLTSPEMDLFGYMFTGGRTLTRKGTLGITKAIALHPYNADVGFYSNHDFVRRRKEAGNHAEPNLFSKEEFSGLFKATFTIDSEKLGKELLILDGYNVNSNKLTLELEKPQSVTLQKVEFDEENDDGKIYIINGKIKAKVSGNMMLAPLQKGIVQKKENQITLKGTPEVVFRSEIVEKKNDHIEVEIESYNNKAQQYISLKTKGGLSISIKGKKGKDENFFIVTLGEKECQIELLSDKKIGIPKDLLEPLDEGGFRLKNDMLKTKDLTIEINDEDEVEDEELGTVYSIALNKEPDYNEKAKTLTVEKGLTIPFEFDEDRDNTTFDTSAFSESKTFVKSEIGEVTINKLKDKQKYHAILSISDIEKKKRIVEILRALKNGLYAQSSGESNTIVPLFFMAGAVKIPSPVFHSFIDIEKSNGKFKVVGVSDALRNSWLEESVYIQDCDRIIADVDKVSLNLEREADGLGQIEPKINWKEFLKSTNLLVDAENKVD